MKVYEENAGNLTAFLKDGRTDDLYYTWPEIYVEGIYK